MFQCVDLLNQSQLALFYKQLLLNLSEINEYLLGSKDKNAEHQAA